jgi:hypothetical protein
MLTPIQLQQQRRRRPPPSLKQQYQQYILQRIEGFKNSIPREELLRIGDEAVAEMDVTVEGQFVLTEVLMQDSVDRLIRKRLALRSYRRWCEQFRALRLAQREPTHWGVDARCPVAGVLPRVEAGDLAVVIGAGAQAHACLLAAHDMEVVFLGADLASVDQVEARIATESLANNFTAYVAMLGQWLPPLPSPLHLVVLDSSVLEDLSPSCRRDLVGELQALTEATGVHVILPGNHSLAPEAFLTLYEDWSREDDSGTGRRASSHRSHGLRLSRVARQNDTAKNESKTHDRLA